MTKIAKAEHLVSRGVVEVKILLIRGKRVMLDRDLALLYVELMLSQNAIASRKQLGGYRPYVFTE